MLVGLLAVLVFMQIAIAGVARAQSSFLTGFTDSAYGEAAPVREAWLERTTRVGAQIVLLQASWPSIAPTRPADPADPNDPAYHWQGLDEQVQAATAHGLRVAIAVSYAPAWAEGPGRPASAIEGTWRPDPAAFAVFAHAIAERYSGAFPDPLHPGAMLSRVSYWQAWTEPNLPDHLSPQWTKRGGRYVPESPRVYRALLNSFYGAVKSVRSDNFVVTAGTAPFGDPPGGERVPPALFVRELLCVNIVRAWTGEAGGALRAVSCPEPAHFDALAHDPYSIAGPYQHALNSDDVSVPDMASLSAPLHLAERTGRALPRGRKQLWVTEFSWDSYPPKPHGVPIQEHARWLEEAFYELWREHVNVAIWYQVRDALPIPNYASSYQSGVYFHDGTPKPAARAFKFPFVLRRASPSSLSLWLRAPIAGRLAVQRLVGKRWRTVLAMHVGPDQIVYRSEHLAGRLTMRARVGAVVSLPFSER